MDPNGQQAESPRSMGLPSARPRLLVSAAVTARVHLRPEAHRLITSQTEDLVLVVNVDIRVKPGMAEAFVKETLINVEQSRREPGIHAFELLVDPSDGNHFLLVETYDAADAPAAHKATLHYKTWRDVVEPMMQSPRSSSKWTTQPTTGAG
jgi:(4S)-4-hydroxy-5-phosphonooxypentane-2,3-dione isomerase